MFSHMVVSPFIFCLIIILTHGRFSIHAEELNSDLLKVLIITGKNNHDWRSTTPVLKRSLESTGIFEVSVSKDPSAVVLDDPELEKYDAILLNYNGPRWSNKREKTLLNFVRQGGGLVIVHAANNAFSEWTEFNEMIGVGWRAGAGHGRPHAFRLELVDRSHPVTSGMRSKIVHTEDELYHNLTGPLLEKVPPVNTKYRVLAHAFSTIETGGTGKNEPMVIATNYYRGRVFHTPMGHFLHSMKSVCFQTFLARGTQWSITGEVTLSLPEALSELP